MFHFHKWTNWAQTSDGQTRACLKCQKVENEHIHKWTAWEQYFQPMVYYERFLTSATTWNGGETRQKRKCEICNFVEDVNF